MENASNALLMAAGVLIAMLVIAVAVVIFTQYGQLGNTYSTKMSQQEVINFNNNFTVFDGRTNITASEIASLVNFVNEYKEQTEIEVTIVFPEKDKYKKNLTEFVKDKSTDDSNNIIYYKCNNSIKYDGPFGMVSYIKFEQNK